MVERVIKDVGIIFMLDAPKYIDIDIFFIELRGNGAFDQKN